MPKILKRVCKKKQKNNIMKTQKIENFIESWLSNNGIHLATHANAGYHYLNSNEFDYNGYSSYQSSIEEAIEDGSIWVDSDNCLHICERVIKL